MWDFLDSVESSNIIESVNARGKAAVETEDLVVDQSSEGQEVK